jgi:hypothetical protein
LIVENCFQGYLFTTNTDNKNTENSKKQFKAIILACFSHLATGISRAEKRREKFKKTTPV